MSQARKRPQLPPGEAGPSQNASFIGMVYKQKLANYPEALKTYEHYLDTLLSNQINELNKIAAI